MEQVYTPDLNVRAYPALCQKYINDAGHVANANPPRSGTAKAAFEKEKNANRIRGDELPENVWVVAWFSFSRGSYTYPDGTTIYYKDAWHVAFARRKGNTVELHDSEVHSGSRQPYHSLQELEAWFGAYGAKYAGWSTECDGRIYAKEKSMAKSDLNTARILAMGVLGRNGITNPVNALKGDCDDDLKKNHVGVELTNEYIGGLFTSKEAANFRSELAKYSKSKFKKVDVYVPID